MNLKRLTEAEVVIDMIEFESVNYTYDGENKAVENAGFKIGNGEFVGIIGRTGSGKSTIIQMMNGLLKPSSGRVLYNGQSIFDKNYNLRDLKFKVGLVFQYPEYQLFECSVIKDVAYGPENKGLNEEAAVSAAKMALEMVGISEDKYEKSPFDLSGGEKKRVAIAGILAMNPEVLVLDEPAAGLDPKSRRNLFTLLKTLQKENGITIVVVSHSMEDMAEYADHILVMDNGLIAMNGSAKDVFTDYKSLESMGLAAPKVTYLMAELKRRGIPADTGIITMEEAVKCLETLL